RQTNSSSRFAGAASCARPAMASAAAEKIRMTKRVRRDVLNMPRMLAKPTRQSEIRSEDTRTPAPKAASNTRTRSFQEDAMLRVFVFGTLAALLTASPAAAQNASSAGAAGLLVSTEWLAGHLEDPTVRVIATGDEGRYDRGHIPGARFLEHMDTLGNGHH